MIGFGLLIYLRVSFAGQFSLLLILLIQLSHSGTSVFSSFWKVKVPKKVELSAWQVFHGRVHRRLYSVSLSLFYALSRVSVDNLLPQR